MEHDTRKRRPGAHRAITAPPYAANDGDPAAALAAAARWCAAAGAEADAGRAPSVAAVRAALDAATAATTRATLGPLSRALALWAEQVSTGGAHDELELAPLVASAVDIAGACTVAETGEEDGADLFADDTRWSLTPQGEEYLLRRR